MTEYSLTYDEKSDCFNLHRLFEGQEDEVVETYPTKQLINILLHIKEGKLSVQ